MAELFDRSGNFPAISDDKIKEALKTGLMSIQPSNDLINETLDKCKSEILNVNHVKTGKPMGFSLVYKLGASLAAGVLLLVLLLDGNTSLFRMKTSESAPMASAAQSAPESGSAFGCTDNMRSSDDVDIMFSEAAPAETPIPSPSGGEATGMIMKGFKGDFRGDAAFTLQSLNSLPYGSVNESAGTIEDSITLFNSAVEHYNNKNGTDFTLNKNDILRINTLVQGGVSADLLLSANSFNDILSGEGYWALSITDSQGLKMVLSVAELDNIGSDAAVSINELIFDFGQKKLVLSTQPSTLIDTFSLREKASEEGFKTDSEIVVADINYGMDFIAFMGAGGQELAIPVLTNSNVGGLESMKIYGRDELFKTISENMLK